MSIGKKFIAGVIIVVAVVLAISSSWGDSTVVDEVPHIGAGYSYLVKQDYRLNPEHPPLAKDLAAIPLLFLNLNQTAFQTKAWQTDINGQWEFGRALIYNSGNNPTVVTQVARLPMMLFFILSAILVFIWAYELYGQLAAFIALILFSFSPTIMAHSRFVTTDVAALWAVLYATYFFVKYLKAPTHKNLIIAGLIFGLALLAKFSTILLIPLFGLIALIYGYIKSQPHEKIKDALSRALKTVVLMAIGFIIIVWPVYYLHTYNYPIERQHRDTEAILRSIYGDSYARYSFMLNPVVYASGQPIIRAPAHYFLGVFRVFHQTSEPHNTYFLGQVNAYGSHLYFPVVYFIKEPLAWWALVVIALLFLGTQLQRPSRETFHRVSAFIKNHLAEFAMILWLIIYWAASINSTLNIGVRHLLPTYPFAILLVSGLIARVGQKVKAKSKKFSVTFMVVLAILLGSYVSENLDVYPFYLTYFNQTVGGSAGGYEYVNDSNLDWGQDLRRLADWVKQNNIPRIETDYFGWADPVYYMGQTYEQLWSSKYRDAQDFKSRNDTNGWIAISATFLKGSEGSPEFPKPVNYTWLESFKPVTIVGNSIFIYHIK